MQKDIAEKRLEEYNDVFADIFNALLFGGEKIVDEESLMSMTTEAFTRNLDGRLRQGNRDIRKADKRNGTYRLILGEENQEGRDNTMPQRVMGYDYATYEAQIRQLMEENAKSGHPAVTKRLHDNQKLAPVITLVLYWGKEEWKKPLTLHDMLQFPDGIKDRIRPFVADYPLNLIQLAQLPRESREHLTSDFRLIAEYVACKDRPDELKKVLSDRIHTIRHTEEFLDTLSAIGGERRYREIKKQIIKKKEKEEMTMYSIAEELENQGIEKGLQEGIELGVQALILDNREEQKSEEQIRRKLEKRFSLSTEEAERYLRKYNR